ncbi:MAG TPA: endonuclease/exonuclease/phosphatase family protein [Orrella sp.]
MQLVTWNTQWCKGLDGIVSAQRIVDGARAMGDFDVLCLQEIAQNYPSLTGDTAIDQPAEIARLLPGFEVVFGAAIDEQPLGQPLGQPQRQPLRQRFGNLIASRLPILQIQHLYLPSPMTSSITPGSTHAWMPRQCTVCTVQADWGPVRIMTTHLEYHSELQRLAQAQALRHWHQMFCEQQKAGALVDPNESGTPYQTKPYTADAILCGDCNFEPHSDPYEVLTSPEQHHPFHDAWTRLHAGEPHPPTFRLYDDTYGPDAVSCDFCFVSETLAPRLKHIAVDTTTQVSDHQPVMIDIC